MVGAAGGGAAGGGAAGGGGGGGGGTFFLQLAANTINVSASPMTVNFRVLNINNLLNVELFAPNGGPIVALRGQLFQLCSIRQHGPDLMRSGASGHKHQVLPVRGPARIFIAPFAMRQLRIVARGDVHDEYVEITAGISLRPGKSDVLPVGVPRRVPGLSFAWGQSFYVCAVHVHTVNLLRAGAS